MKVSLIYFTKSNYTKTCAQYILEGLNDLENIEPRSFSIDTVDQEFVKESKMVIFGSPTYMAQPPYQIPKYFYSIIHSKDFAGKLAGAFATQQFEHGGGQLVIQNIMAHCLTLGMIFYSGGASFGQPAVHLGPVGNSHHIEKTREIFQIYGNRMGNKALELFS
ncbi:MAG: flavodoxin family protein [Tissierellia bacterium]|nr:flavodoxin family protein [Tissierellia bacterium]